MLAAWNWTRGLKCTRDECDGLSALELEDGNEREAMRHAEVALVDATCDGEAYCYKVAQDEARRILNLAKR